MLIAYERGHHVLLTSVTNPVILDQWWSPNRMDKDSSVHLGMFLKTDNSLIPSVWIRAEVLNLSRETPRGVTRSVLRG